MAKPAPWLLTKGVHHRFHLTRQEGIIRIQQANHISHRAPVGRIEIGRHAAVRVAQQPHRMAAVDIGFAITAQE